MLAHGFSLRACGATVFYELVWHVAEVAAEVAAIGDSALRPMFGAGDGSGAGTAGERPNTVSTALAAAEERETSSRVFAEALARATKALVRGELAASARVSWDICW